MAAKQRFGLTWWGQRWIGALEALGAAYANRLPRGRSYARQGTVLDLTVAPGEVIARVRGRRPQPYRVNLRIPTFSEKQWTAVTTALAGQVRHSAALLDGRMPEDVDEVLAGCGWSLFPQSGELTTRCSCPDVANPCKHVAAVHYVLAQTFDADPFLLPTLRGRDREALLAGLRAARTGEAPDIAADPVGAADGVPLSSLSALTLFAARGDLAAIAVHPRPPVDPAAFVRRLGPPPGVDESAGDRSVLEAAVAGGSERAWQLAADDHPNVDDPLLEELRELGTATSQELSESLGWHVEVVRAGLRGLIEAGLAYRTGHARSTQYHA